MTKDVNRSAYTRRILEIVSNIKKQNNEIENVSCVITEFLKIIFYLNSLIIFFCIYAFF